MTWTNVKWIYLREIRDQMRDRRTLFTIFILPLLLYPILGMGFLQVAQFSREHQTPVLIVGADALPQDPPLVVTAEGEGQGVSLAEAVCPSDEQRLFRLQLAESDVPRNPDSLKRYAEQQIQAGKFDAVVFFPPDFADKLAAFDRKLADVVGQELAAPEPQIFSNSANDKSQIARERVERVLYRWRQSIVSENLRQQNVPPAATEPFQIVKTDVARESSRRAAVWSKILPFIVLVWALTGAFYPAVDLCAGEKERGTLETLLCSPAQRIEIVWGKLLTIMTFSMATSILNLISIAATGAFVMMQFEQIAGPMGRSVIGFPPISALAWLSVALIPLSALFSALSLAVAAFARSSKEGQYYLMPLLFVTLPLMMLSLMPTAELDLGTSLIPVTGVMLMLRSLIEAHYMEALRYAAPVIVITGICCWLAISWAVRQFNNESVLFRESERWGLGIWMRHLLRDRGELPSMAESLFCGVLLLLFMKFFAPLWLDVPHDWRSFAVTTTVTLVAFVATPALIMSLILTRSPQATLLLRMPRPAGLLLTIVLAVVIHPAGMAVTQVVSQLYPMNPALEGHLQAMQSIIEQAPSTTALLLVLALVPAICEEIAFRGFILAGLRQIDRSWAAIVGSALFFGATHAFVQQSITAFVLGLVLGYVAVQTRSLLPGLFFHGIYNSLSVLLGTVGPAELPLVGEFGWLFQITGESVAYRWPIVMLSFVVSGVLLWSLRRPSMAASAWHGGPSQAETGSSSNHPTLAPAALVSVTAAAASLSPAASNP